MPLKDKLKSCFQPGKERRGSESSSSDSMKKKKSNGKIVNLRREKSKSDPHLMRRSPERERRIRPETSLRQSISNKSLQPKKWKFGGSGKLSLCGSLSRPEDEFSDAEASGSSKPPSIPPHGSSSLAAQNEMANRIGQRLHASGQDLVMHQPSIALSSSLSYPEHANLTIERSRAHSMDRGGILRNANSVGQYVVTPFELQSEESVSIDGDNSQFVLKPAARGRNPDLIARVPQPAVVTKPARVIPDDMDDMNPFSRNVPYIAQSRPPGISLKKSFRKDALQQTDPTAMPPKIMPHIPLGQAKTCRLSDSDFCLSESSFASSNLDTASITGRYPLLPSKPPDPRLTSFNFNTEVRPQSSNRKKNENLNPFLPNYIKGQSRQSNPSEPFNTQPHSSHERPSSSSSVSPNSTVTPSLSADQINTTRVTFKPCIENFDETQLREDDIKFDTPKSKKHHQSCLANKKPRPQRTKHGLVFVPEICLSDADFITTPNFLENSYSESSDSIASSHSSTKSAATLDGSQEDILEYEEASNTTTDFSVTKQKKEDFMLPILNEEEYSGAASETESLNYSLSQLLSFGSDEDKTTPKEDDELSPYDSDLKKTSFLLSKLKNSDSFQKAISEQPFPLPPDIVDGRPNILRRIDSFEKAKENMIFMPDIDPASLKITNPYSLDRTLMMDSPPNGEQDIDIFFQENKDFSENLNTILPTDNENFIYNHLCTVNFSKISFTPHPSTRVNKDLNNIGSPVRSPCLPITPQFTTTASNLSTAADCCVFEGRIATSLVVTFKSIVAQSYSASLEERKIDDDTTDCSAVVLLNYQPDFTYSCSSRECRAENNSLILSSAGAAHQTNSTSPEYSTQSIKPEQSNLPKLNERINLFAISADNLQHYNNVKFGNIFANYLLKQLNDIESADNDDALESTSPELQSDNLMLRGIKRRARSLIQHDRDKIVVTKKTKSKSLRNLKAIGKLAENSAIIMSTSVEILSEDKSGSLTALYFPIQSSSKNNDSGGAPSTSSTRRFSFHHRSRTRSAPSSTVTSPHFRQTQKFAVAASSEDDILLFHNETANSSRQASRSQSTSRRRGGKRSVSYSSAENDPDEYGYNSNDLSNNSNNMLQCNSSIDFPRALASAKMSILKEVDSTPTRDNISKNTNSGVEGCEENDYSQFTSNNKNNITVQMHENLSNHSADDREKRISSRNSPIKNSNVANSRKEEYTSCEAANTAAKVLGDVQQDVNTSIKSSTYYSDDSENSPTNAVFTQIDQAAISPTYVSDPISTTNANYRDVDSPHIGHETSATNSAGLGKDIDHRGKQHFYQYAAHSVDHLVDGENNFAILQSGDDSELLDYYSFNTMDDDTNSSKIDEISDNLFISARCSVHLSEPELEDAVSTCSIPPEIQNSVERDRTNNGLSLSFNYTLPHSHTIMDETNSATSSRKEEIYLEYDQPLILENALLHSPTKTSPILCSENTVSVLNSNSMDATVSPQLSSNNSKSNIQLPEVNTHSYYGDNSLDNLQTSKLSISASTNIPSQLNQVSSFRPMIYSHNQQNNKSRTDNSSNSAVQSNPFSSENIPQRDTDISEACKVDESKFSETNVCPNSSKKARDDTDSEIKYLLYQEMTKNSEAKNLGLHKASELSLNETKVKEEDEEDVNSKFMAKNEALTSPDQEELMNKAELLNSLFLEMNQNTQLKQSEKTRSIETIDISSVPPVQPIESNDGPKEIKIEDNVKNIDASYNSEIDSSIQQGNTIITTNDIEETDTNLLITSLLEEMGNRKKPRQKKTTDCLEINNSNNSRKIENIQGVASSSNDSDLNLSLPEVNPFTVSTGIADCPDNEQDIPEDWEEQSSISSLTPSNSNMNNPKVLSTKQHTIKMSPEEDMLLKKAQRRAEQIKMMKTLKKLEKQGRKASEILFKADTEVVVHPPSGTQLLPDKSFLTLDKNDDSDLYLKTNEFSDCVNNEHASTKDLNQTHPSSISWVLTPKLSDDNKETSELRKMLCNQVTSSCSQELDSRDSRDLEERRDVKKHLEQGIEINKTTKNNQCFMDSPNNQSLQTKSISRSDKELASSESLKQGDEESKSKSKFEDEIQDEVVLSNNSDNSNIVGLDMNSRFNLPNPINYLSSWTLPSTSGNDDSTDKSASIRKAEDIPNSAAESINATSFATEKEVEVMVEEKSTVLTEDSAAKSMLIASASTEKFHTAINKTMVSLESYTKNQGAVNDLNALMKMILNKEKNKETKASGEVIEAVVHEEVSEGDEHHEELCLSSTKICPNLERNQADSFLIASNVKLDDEEFQAKQQRTHSYDQQKVTGLITPAFDNFETEQLKLKKHIAKSDRLLHRDDIIDAGKLTRRMETGEEMEAISDEKVETLPDIKEAANIVNEKSPIFGDVSPTQKIDDTTFADSQIFSCTHQAMISPTMKCSYIPEEDVTKVLLNNAMNQLMESVQFTKEDLSEKSVLARAAVDHMIGKDMNLLNNPDDSGFESNSQQTTEPLNPANISFINPDVNNLYPVGDTVDSSESEPIPVEFKSEQTSTYEFFSAKADDLPNTPNNNIEEIFEMDCPTPLASDSNNYTIDKYPTETDLSKNHKQNDKRDYSDVDSEDIGSKAKAKSKIQKSKLINFKQDSLQETLEEQIPKQEGEFDSGFSSYGAKEAPLQAEKTGGFSLGNYIASIMPRKRSPLSLKEAIMPPPRSHNVQSICSPSMNEDQPRTTTNNPSEIRKSRTENNVFLSAMSRFISPNTRSISPNARFTTNSDAAEINDDDDEVFVEGLAWAKPEDHNEYIDIREREENVKRSMMMMPNPGRVMVSPDEWLADPVLRGPLNELMKMSSGPRRGSEGSLVPVRRNSWSEFMGICNISERFSRLHNMTSERMRDPMTATGLLLAATIAAPYYNEFSQRAFQTLGDILSNFPNHLSSMTRMGGEATGEGITKSMSDSIEESLDNISLNAIFNLGSGSSTTTDNNPFSATAPGISGASYHSRHELFPSEVTNNSNNSAVIDPALMRTGPLSTSPSLLRRSAGESSLGDGFYTSMGKRMWKMQSEQENKSEK